MHVLDPWWATSRMWNPFYQATHTTRPLSTPLNLTCPQLTLKTHCAYATAQPPPAARKQAHTHCEPYMLTMGRQGTVGQRCSFMSQEPRRVAPFPIFALGAGRPCPLTVDTSLQTLVAAEVNFQIILDFIIKAISPRVFHTFLQWLRRPGLT